jgi:hypothetical protein
MLKKAGAEKYHAKTLTITPKTTMAAKAGTMRLLRSFKPVNPF